MKTTKLGYHDKDYCIKVYYWAKRLEADECIIHKNGSVSLYCKDGIICEREFPTADELYNNNRNIKLLDHTVSSWLEYIEY